MDKKTALLYARLNPYKALVNKTSGFIRWALERVENPYVACSFGKDSAVMLHLCLKYRPDIPVICFMWPETLLIDNYLEVISLWGNINLYQMKFNVEINKNGNEHIIQDEYIKRMNYDSYFLGIRKQENKGRLISLKVHGMFYKMKDELIRISPLADWKTNDIAAYILSNEIPLLNTYKKEGFSARTTTAIPVNYDGPRKRALENIKRNDINAFNRLVKLCPQLKEFV